MVKKIDLPASEAFKVHPPTSAIMATCISKDGKPNIIPLGMYMWISFEQLKQLKDELSVLIEEFNKVK